MGNYWFITGGVRSGKSYFAEQLAASWKTEVVFLATAEAIDDDMTVRIINHQKSRPPEWITIEEPMDVSGALGGIPSSSDVVIDCLTVWVGNLFHHAMTVENIESRAHRLVDRLALREGRTVVVSNEVGMGIHPESEMGRQYRDCLGRVNSIVAAGSASSIFMSAGRAIILQDVQTLI